MIDVFYILIPFIFILAIVYGALEFSNVFKNKRVNIIIALAVAFFAITTDFAVTFIYQVLPYALIFFVIFFFLGFFKSDKKDGEKDYTLLMVVAALVLILLVTKGYEVITSENTIVLVGIIIIALLFMAAYKLGKGT